MAKTSIETSNALRVQVWHEKLFRDMRIDTFFSKFMSKEKNALIQEKTDLSGDKPGDKVTFGLVARLYGAGRTSRQTLEGNEEALKDYNFDVELEEYVHGVRDRGPLDRKRPIYNMDSEAKEALQIWGSEKVDRLCFSAITATPTEVWYPNSSGVMTLQTTPATAIAGLHATNSLLSNLNHISLIKTWAKTGGNMANATSYTRSKIQPIRYGGKDYYILLVHPDVLYDMKSTSEYKQLNREAQERGKDNPLFTGAEFAYDGVIVYEHELIPIATDGGGSTVPYAKCVFGGAQALCAAWGKRPQIVADEFDYVREHGFSIQMMFGVEKPKFNSKDFGSVGVYFSRPKVSDA